jgi:hypothetical protein
MLILYIDNEMLFMIDDRFLMTDCGKDASKEYSTAVLSTFIIKNGNKSPYGLLPLLKMMRSDSFLFIACNSDGTESINNTIIFIIL